MAPTIFREGKYRFFFFSREESRIHVHISHPDGEAKFWLTPELELATSIGLSAKQLKGISKNSEFAQMQGAGKISQRRIYLGSAD